MPVILKDAVLRDDLAKDLLPVYTAWSRLEVVPTSYDLSAGIRAEVADPLWMLGRQWQFGEFRGEDAGTPVEVRLGGESAMLSRYAPGPVSPDADQRAQDYRSIELPLEAQVECEQAWGSHHRLALEAGLHFLRALAAEGAVRHAAAFRASYTLDPIPVDDPQADPDAARWVALLGAGVLDARKLRTALQPLLEAGALTGLPPQPAIPAEDADAVKRAALRWLKWMDAFLVDPGKPAPAWNPKRQEYAFTLAAKFSAGPITLIADEYTDGQLDWYSFRAQQGPDLGAPAAPIEPVTIKPPPTLPTPARFPGMPASRFWEFEDARVNLAGLESGPTDLSRMLLAEFALVYGNDWFVVPLDLPVGSVFRVTEFHVRDTFGIDTPIHSSRNIGGTVWNMFSLSAPPGAPDYLQDVLFVAPALGRAQDRFQGDPVEQVALFRDEMANMAWGVERKVQGAIGLPRDRYLESARHVVHQSVNGPIDAPLIYRLATPVPEQWIPFVPVPATPNQPPAQFAIQLERRVLLRTLADGSRVPAHPKGLLLRTRPDAPVGTEPPLRLEEEEVPREGAVVDRAFQFARWIDGSRFLWLGRRKRVGKGEGSSGLRFDSADRIA
jgi:hypothetical protein